MENTLAKVIFLCYKKLLLVVCLHLDQIIPVQSILKKRTEVVNQQTREIMNNYTGEDIQNHQKDYA